MVSNETIFAAVQLLNNGKLVALPTETVYGLGADAENEHAVASVYAVKARPQFNPLIVHVNNLSMAARYGVFSPLARTLAESFWPGPMTLVVPRRAGSPLSLLLSAGTDTVALRCPAHPIAQKLLNAFGRGIAAPSANRSGRVSPTTPTHVAEEFPNSPELAMILDGGACSVGIESTVIDCRESRPALLRPGAVTFEMLQQAGFELADAAKGAHAASPGQLSSHYAPSLPVRLNALTVTVGEALLAFGPDVPRGAVQTLNLSISGNLREAAANLFAYLRQLDQPSFKAIAVMPIPTQGIGTAINDRLRRAATR